MGVALAQALAVLVTSAMQGKGPVWRAMRSPVRIA